jgi:hypothetical protein
MYFDSSFAAGTFDRRERSAATQAATLQLLQLARSGSQRRLTRPVGGAETVRSAGRPGALYAKRRNIPLGLAQRSDTLTPPTPLATEHSQG